LYRWLLLNVSLLVLPNIKIEAFKIGNPLLGFVIALTLGIFARKPLVIGNRRFYIPLGPFGFEDLTKEPPGFITARRILCSKGLESRQCCSVLPGGHFFFCPVDEFLWLSKAFQWGF